MSTDSGKPATIKVDTKFDLAFVVQINDKPYTFNSNDIQQFKTEGIKFSLPGPVLIGNIDALQKFLNKELKGAGINLPDGSSFPAPFDDLFSKAKEINFTIEKFTVDYQKGGNYGFDLSITATPPPSKTTPPSKVPLLDLKIFQVAEIIFEISRPATPAATPADKSDGTSAGQ